MKPKFFIDLLIERIKIDAAKLGNLYEKPKQINSLQEERSIDEIINEGDEDILVNTRFETNRANENPQAVDVYFKKRNYCV